jgi:hypothetical protein
MNAKSRSFATIFFVPLLVAACAGPAASDLATDATPTPSATHASMLPDGIWEVALPSGASVEGGVYRWTFDGTRARVSKDDDWQCDADASPAGEAVTLTWHAGMLCGGWDTIGWAVESDGLHLWLVDTSCCAEGTRAILETAPYQAVEGDATLAWSDAWMNCANPDGGACLNTLEAGTYSTEAFEPRLTYTVPGGWQNVSDIAGEVVFLPPGESLGNLEADSIVVFTSVRAENRTCSTEAEATSDEPGVARTPEAMAAEFQARPGLVTTAPEAVTIGGLSGLVMDISMAPDWTGTCFYSTEPVVQLMGGVAPSELDHSVIAGLTLRLYLLERGDSTLAIEIGDFTDESNLDEYTEIVEQFEFGT